MHTGGRAEWLLEQNTRPGRLARLVLLGALLHVGVAFVASGVRVGRVGARRAAQLFTEFDLRALPAAPESPARTAPPALAARVGTPSAHHLVARRAMPHDPAAAPGPSRAAPVMVATPRPDDATEPRVATADNASATGATTGGDAPSQGPGSAGDSRGRDPTLQLPGGPAAPAVVPPAVRPRDYAVHAAIECDDDAVRGEYPDVAREAGASDAVVRVRVAVEPDGRIARVTALNDPGFGFAAAAARAVRRFCRATPARDHEGRPAAETIESFRVTFLQE